MRSSRLVAWCGKSNDSYPCLWLLMVVMFVSVCSATPGFAQPGAGAKKVATPIFSPPGGTFTSPRQVTIATSTAGAAVYYTVDGSLPSTSSVRYSGAITVSTTTTLRAIAVRSSWTPSDVATATIAMNFGTLTPPVMAPAQGFYHSPVPVTLSAQSGTTIRYTLNGGLPTESSTEYTTPVMLTATATLRARAFRRDYSPSAEVQGLFTIQLDVTPPTISSVFSAAPHSAGWFRTSVLVGFSCADTESAIVSCTAPVNVSAEGRQVVNGQAIDAAGNSASLQVPVNVDLTPPVLSVSSPPAGEPLPPTTTAVAIQGSFQDTSGVSSLTCGGSVGSIAGNAFTCTVPVIAGTNPISISAVDVAGHSASLALTVVVSEPGELPTSIEVSPETLLMFVGETRGLAVTDERGRLVSGGAWSFSAPIAEVAQRPGTCQPAGSVACLEPADVTILRATAPGEVTVTVTYLGLTTSSTISILQAGSAPAPGTTMWALTGGSVQAPVRAQVIPAVPQVGGDPQRDAGLFFVDEARQWQGTRFGPTNSKLEIRTTTADGRELWRMRETGPATLKYGALADARGGIIVVMQNGLDLTTQSFYPDKVRRFDGRTGAITWEYEPEWFYTLSEPAVHPDGTVYFTEEAGVSTNPPSHLVGISPNGAVEKWSLPSGTFTRHDAGTGQMDVDHRPSPALAGQPIVRDDDTVVLVARTIESTQYVISSIKPDGTLTWRDDDAHVNEIINSGWVIELAPDGELRSYQVSRGSSVWATFRPQDWKLLPDGQGGLLVGHRSLRTLLHFDTAHQVSSGVLATGGGNTFGMEYVLGDDGAYALEHGGFGGTFWTKTYRFNPVTLAVLATNWVTSNQSEPSNLRLQFATAGGGVYLSGPTVSPTSGSTGGTLAMSAASASTVTNATQIAEGVWAGWSNGPALVWGDEVSRANTAWPFAGGTVDSSNSSLTPGVGIFAKGHTINVLPVFRHASIRLVPRDQDYWRRVEPEVFKYVDPSTGKYFATIGAGLPEGDTGIACSGALVSAFNRELDVNREARDLERLRYPRATENLLITELLAANRNYRNDLRYECFPDQPEDEYNSNSFAAGILRAVRLPFPRFPDAARLIYPGWSKPVPLGKFAVQH